MRQAESRTGPASCLGQADKSLTQRDRMPSARLQHDPDLTQPTGRRGDGSLVVRRILTLTALVAGLGCIATLTAAGADGIPRLEPVARIQQAGQAYMQLAALHARAETQELRYEPSRREHEDDDDQDEPRR
jgi:hypothetical protein